MDIDDQELFDQLAAAHRETKDPEIEALARGLFGDHPAPAPRPAAAGLTRRKILATGARFMHDLPPRQALALSFVLRKMFEEDRTEVSMSRYELARVSNFTEGGAKRALNGLVDVGALKRTAKPHLGIHREVQARQRDQNWRRYWFYYLPRMDLPEVVAGPLLPVPVGA